MANGDFYNFYSGTTMDLWLNGYNTTTTTTVTDFPDWQHLTITTRPEDEPVKIPLTLEEIQYLQELAKKDKKLRRIVRKFREYIDIRVDFQK